ncbi:MAG: hypothetical protein ABIY56_09300 [Dokdonella sp.]
MKRSQLVALLLSAWCSSSAVAQSGATWLTIPSSGFTGQNSEGGYGGNATGTTRLFAASSLMLAPVILPHGATVTSLYCGGMAPVTDLRLVFTLRRNAPQVANIDMVTAATTYAGNGFQWTFSDVVDEPEVDNKRFNYYIVSEVDNQLGANLCPACTINFCRIGYIDPDIFSDGFETGV